ncbi:6-bladed beta-propeller [Parabacteroides chinchillae]|uniref:6-bladed beta-propeller protein n=1 Tax=Parabacteroides chinchillae TaxID=871327 RepID=A0A8G2BZ59_9BACT|nr:6-bladed beta-propeller [Parabacteroides chinchillae]SEG28907.1 6-bladed beta-propeller protein [Parabacteroides chinchillae]
MVQIIKYCVFVIFILLFSCNSHKSTDKNKENHAIIAHNNILKRYRDNISDTVIVCDISLAKNKKELPINLLVDTLSIITFDNLIKDRLENPFVPVFRFSDNYICMYSNAKSPLMLFDKKGAFIRNIGRIGEKLGQYINIDNIFMDEENNRIYILPINTDFILEYDFLGKYYRNIPLVHKNISGSSFQVNSKNEEILILTPFNSKTEHCIWIQDFTGKRLQSIAPYTYYRDISYSGSMAITYFQMQEISYFHYRVNNGSDYLYHFIKNRNRLSPRFRIKNTEDNIPYYIYELPNHFIIEVDKRIANAENLSYQKVIIDKKKLTGCAFDCFSSDYNILLGNKHPILLNTISNGYFSEYYFLSEIISFLEKNNNTTDNLKNKNSHISTIDLKSYTKDYLFLFVGKLKK